MSGATTGSPSASKASRGRVIIARILVVLGILLGVVSIYANFVKREALDSDTFRETSSELIANHVIRAQVAATTVEQLYRNVDVAAELEAQLPENLQGLAGPIAGASRELAERAAATALERPAVQALFVGASSVAHEQLVNVLADDARFIETAGGTVVLDLRPIVLALGDRFNIVSNLADRIPEDAAQITILESQQLGTAQTLTQLLKTVANWIWAPTLALWALAVWLVPGRRRQELRAIAIGFVVAGIAVVALRALVGSYIVDNVVATDSVRPAVREVWSILTDSLAAVGWTVFAIGVIAVAGILLTGAGRRAQAARRSLAPYMHRSDVAYAALAVLILLFLWWAPLHNVRNVLIVVVLSIVGFELLRRQTTRDFPDAPPADILSSFRSWREGRSRPVLSGEEPRAQPPVSTASELERLARLRTDGVLTEAEFASAKARLLTPG